MCDRPAKRRFELRSRTHLYGEERRTEHLREWRAVQPRSRNSIACFGLNLLAEFNTKVSEYHNSCGSSLTLIPGCRACLRQNVPGSAQRRCSLQLTPLRCPSLRLAAQLTPLRRPGLRLSCPAYAASLPRSPPELPSLRRFAAPPRRLRRYGEFRHRGDSSERCSRQGQRDAKWIFRGGGLPDCALRRDHI